MFERFTDAGRQIVVYAQDEARELRHASIGTEHLLLGVLREGDGVGAHALAALRFTLEDTRAAVARLSGPGDEAPPRGSLPFTPAAKQTLELSLREAIALEHRFISTEHVLLALARKPDGVPAEIFKERELDERRIRGVVAKLIANPPGRLERVRKAGWEYRIVDLPTGDLLTVQRLEELGADRWELVSVYGVGEGVRAVLKRRT